MTDVERYANHVRYDADEMHRALIRESFWDELKVAHVDKAIGSLEYALARAKTVKVELQRAKDAA